MKRYPRRSHCGRCARQHVHYAGAGAGGVAQALHPHAAVRDGIHVSPHRVTPGDAFMNAACDDCVVGEAVVPTQPRACSTRTAPAVSAAMPPRSSTPRVNPRPALTPSPRNRVVVGVGLREAPQPFNHPKQ